MKIIFKMMGIVALIIVLAACSKTNEKSDSLGKEETGSLKKEELLQELGNSIDESELQKKARYHVDLTEGNLVYRLYLFADDETSWVQESGTYEANEGDVLYEGNYQVALGLKGEETFYVQDQLDLWGGNKMRWNATNPRTQKIGDDILALYQPESSNIQSAVLLSIIGGEVKELTPQDGLFLTGSLKQINDTTYQTALYSNSDPGFGWSFFTYQREDDELKLVDKISYDGESGALSVEAGAYWYDLWVETEDFFVPYRDLKPDSTWLEEAKNGKLVGVSFQLNTQIQTIRQAQPRVMEEGYYEGGPYLSYPTETYFYSEIGENVIVLGLPGNRVGGTLKQFIQNVGKPDDEGIDYMTEEHFALYKTGENQLFVYADPETDRIQSIQLYGRK